MRKTMIGAFLAFALAACGTETVGDSRDHTCRDANGNPVGYQVHVAIDPNNPQGSIPRDGMHQMARITISGTAPTGCTPAETKVNNGFIWADGSASLNIDGLPYRIASGGGSDVEAVYQSWRLANGAAHFNTQSNQATAILVSRTASTYAFSVDLSNISATGGLQWRLGGWSYTVGSDTTNHDALVDNTPGAELTVE